MNSSPIIVENYDVGDIQIDSQHIRSEKESLFPNLVIPFIIRLKSNPSTKVNYTLISMRGNLFFISPENIEYRMGIFQSEPLLYFSSDQTQSTQSIIQLTHHIFKQIEDKRNGDVQLKMDLRLLLSTHTQSSANTMEYKAQELLVSKCPITIQISQSNWIKQVLNNSGYSNIKLIEIPIPQNSIPKIYQSALDEISSAERYFLWGDYEKAISHCRKAIELIPRARKIKLPDTEKNGYNIKVECLIDQHLSFLSKTHKDVIKKYLETAYDLTSISHHSVNQKEYFSRADAEMCIIICTALLSYIGKALESSV